MRIVHIFTFFLDGSDSRSVFFNGLYGRVLIIFDGFPRLVDKWVEIYENEMIKNSL